MERSPRTGRRINSILLPGMLGETGIAGVGGALFGENDYALRVVLGAGQEIPLKQKTGHSERF